MTLMMSFLSKKNLISHKNNHHQLNMKQLSPIFLKVSILNNKIKSIQSKLILFSIKQAIQVQIINLFHQHLNFLQC